MVLIGGAEERAAIQLEMSMYFRLPKTPNHYSPRRWQLQCLPKRWTILNIRRGTSPKAEGYALNSSRKTPKQELV
jgi:hypothetical protein